MVEAAGQVAVGTATRAAALAEAATMAEATTGQDASAVEAVERELVRWRNWRRLETPGRQRCCSCASCWHGTLEKPLALGDN